VIVWRGWGILVVLIAFLGLLAGQLIGTAVMGASNYDSNATWLVGLGLLLAAAVLWPIGKRLNSGSRTFIDKETGREIVVRPGHSLFFVPMQFWAPILGVIALLMIVNGQFSAR
jgi:hypothetical protein